MFVFAFAAPRRILAEEIHAACYHRRQMSPLGRLIGSYSYHDDERDTSLQRRVRLLAAELKCREAEIRMAIHKYPRLLSIRQTKLLDIISILRGEGVSKDEILTYPDIFTHSLKSLTERIGELKKLEEKVKLVSLRESSRLYGRKIQRIQNDRECEVPYDTREELLVARLHCMHAEASELLEKHALTTTKLSTLKLKLELLADLPSEMVLRKLWILRFPVDVLEYRLKVMTSSGLSHENCERYMHLLTCEEKYFESRFQRQLGERLILGDYKNKSEYLQKRLACDAETIWKMTRKNHKLLSTGAWKLKAHLDFIETETLNITDAIEFPRLFNFAVDTIRSRHSEMRELNVDFGIRELALENRSYHRYIEFWKNKSKN